MDAHSDFESDEELYCATSIQPYLFEPDASDSEPEDHASCEELGGNEDVFNRENDDRMPLDIDRLGHKEW